MSVKFTRCRKHKFLYKGDQCPMCWADEQAKSKVIYPRTAVQYEKDKAAEHEAKKAAAEEPKERTICKRHTTKHDPTCRFCNAELAEESAAKKKAVADHCKGCVWLNKNGGTPSCAAVNCVREHGWVAEDPETVERLVSGR